MFSILALRSILGFGIPVACTFAEAILPIEAGAKEAVNTSVFRTNVVQQFPAPSWAENLAVRNNGDLLVTMIAPAADLYNIANPQSSKPATTLIHSFTEVESLLGIAEVKPDFFVVVGTNASGVVAIPGTGYLWSVDFSAGHLSPIIKEITALPQVHYPNGMTALPENPDAVLLADSILGCVWRIDISTGAVNMAIQLPQMVPPSSASWPIGINGVHVRQGFFNSTMLYWTNSFETTIYRLPIDGRTGTSLTQYGIPSVAARAVEGYLFIDDFTIDNEGGIWAAANFNNTILYAPAGSQTLHRAVGAEDSLIMAGCTSCVFGRGFEGAHVLYVTNSGAEVYPVNGTLTQGANVVAVTVSA